MTKIKTIEIENIQKINLVNKNVFIFDYENICVIPKTRTSDDIYIVLEGKIQRGAVKKKFEGVDLGIPTLFVVPIHQQGKNYLDFVLLSILSFMQIKSAPKNIWVCSKDKGYDAYINSMKELGFKNIDRVVFEQVEDACKDNWAKKYNKTIYLLADEFWRRSKSHIFEPVSKKRVSQILNDAEVTNPTVRHQIFEAAKYMNRELRESLS